MSEPSFTEQIKAELESAIAALRAKGWENSYATLYLYVKHDMTEVGSAHVYARAEIDDPEPDNAYFGSHKFTNGAKPVLDFAAEHETLAQARTRAFLEHLGKTAEMAENLGLSADFINPITVLAEQLRTNILEGRK